MWPRLITPGSTYDLYHRQLGEGNLINNLRLGLEKKWIRFVEIGDVPGQREPGAGETNYTNIFRVLREAGYDGFVGMEHGTTSTPEHAMEVVESSRIRDRPRWLSTSVGAGQFDPTPSALGMRPYWLALEGKLSTYTRRNTSPYGERPCRPPLPCLAAFIVPVTGASSLI